MELLRPNYTDKHRELADRLRSRLNIAGSLLDARMSLGLTQEEVGRLAGTKQSRVSEIEAMKGNPTLDTLARVGLAVGLALDYVPLRGTGTIEPPQVEGTAETGTGSILSQDQPWVRHEVTGTEVVCNYG